MRIVSLVAIAIAGSALLPIRADSRSLVFPPFDELVQRSDAIFVARVESVEKSTSPDTGAGNRGSITRFTATCTPLDVWKSTSALPGTIRVSYQDRDAFGPVWNAFNPGKEYVFLVLRGKSGDFLTFGLDSGILPTRGTDVSLASGFVDLKDFHQYINLKISSGSTPQEWRHFVEDLVSRIGFDDLERTPPLVRLANAQPNSEVRENTLIRGLSSRSGVAVHASMWGLIGMESERGFKAITNLYFDLKKSRRWEDYKDVYVLPYQFNECLNIRESAFGRKMARKIRDEFPGEKEFYRGIEFYDGK